MAETIRMEAQRSFLYGGSKPLRPGDTFEAKASDEKWLTGGERAYAKKVTAKQATKAEAADGLSAKTKDELYEIATEREIEGRSSMTKAELLKALK